jgi:hypothetical protein
MNLSDPQFNAQLLLTILKFIFVAISIGHVILILIIQRQIHQADRVASPFTNKLIELGGYINIVLIVLSLIIIILPI